MELAVALSEGMTWLGFKCKKSRVLYVNLEIDAASFINRFAEIYKALKLLQSIVMISQFGTFVAMQFHLIN